MISDIYLCKTKQTLKTKAGKSYYSMMLQDKTGTVDAKVWELTPGIEYFEPMDFIKVEGQVTSFQGSLQLNLRRIRRAKEGEYIPADYMPCSRYNIEDMYKELMGYVDSVKEPHLHELLELFFVKNTAFIKSFKEHSAAKSIHHGFVGGLLEHTLSVTKLCDFYTTRYPHLNHDLLITAAICHQLSFQSPSSCLPLSLILTCAFYFLIKWSGQINLSRQAAGFHIFKGFLRLVFIIKNTEYSRSATAHQSIHCPRLHHLLLDICNDRMFRNRHSLKYIAKTIRDTIKILRLQR